MEIWFLVMRTARSGYASCLMARLGFEARYSGACQHIFRIEITVARSGIWIRVWVALQAMILGSGVADHVILSVPRRRPVYPCRLNRSTQHRRALNLSAGVSNCKVSRG